MVTAPRPMAPARRLRAPGKAPRTLGRHEMVEWLNQTLEMELERLQDCADGVACCQLLEALAPGTVPLHEVDFNSATEQTNARNLAVLARALRRAGLHKEYDAEKVARGNFRELNDLLQWLYALTLKNGAEPGGASAFDARVKALETALRAGARKGRTPGARVTVEMADRLIPRRRPRERADGAPTGGSGRGGGGEPDADLKEHMLESLIERLEENLIIRLGHFDASMQAVEREKAMRDLMRGNLGGALRACGEAPGSPLAARVEAIVATPVQW